MGVIKLVKFNFALGFVVYKEDVNFMAKVAFLSKYVSNVYIYDNSPLLENARNYLDFKNVHYFTCGKNIGLGVGMSTLCAQAFYDGSNRLLFLDQDTVISEKTLDFINIVNNNFDLKDYLAISFSNDDINLQNVKEKSEYIVNDVYVVRNSGTLFNLDNLKKINWFDTSFFVDGVDYEFSLNSSLHNLKLGLVKGVPGFDHISEQGYQKYNFFGKAIFYRTYNFYRILDVIRSSSRLIFRSLIKFKFKYSFLFLRHMLAFLFLQSIIRLSKKEENEK